MLGLDVVWGKRKSIVDRRGGRRRKGEEILCVYIGSVVKLVLAWSRFVLCIFATLPFADGNLGQLVSTSSHKEVAAYADAKVY